MSNIHFWNMPGRLQGPGLGEIWRCSRKISKVLSSENSFVGAFDSDLFWALKRLHSRYLLIAFIGGSLAELDQLQLELQKRKIEILSRRGEYLCFEDPNEFAVEVYAKLEEQK